MTEKVLAAVIRSCVAREMHELEVHLKEHAGPFLVHGNCLKRFTDLHNVQSAFSNDYMPVKSICYKHTYSFVSCLQTLRATTALFDKL